MSNQTDSDWHYFSGELEHYAIDQYDNVKSDNRRVPYKNGREGTKLIKGKDMKRNRESYVFYINGSKKPISISIKRLREWQEKDNQPITIL